MSAQPATREYRITSGSHYRWEGGTPGIPKSSKLVRYPRGSVILMSDEEAKAHADKLTPVTSVENTSHISPTHELDLSLLHTLSIDQLAEYLTLEQASLHPRQDVIQAIESALIAKEEG